MLYTPWSRNIIESGWLNGVQVAYAGYDLHIRRLAASVLNKQYQSADKRWSSRSEAGRGYKKAPRSKKIKRVTKCDTWPRTLTDSLESGETCLGVRGGMQREAEEIRSMRSFVICSALQTIFGDWSREEEMGRGMCNVWRRKEMATGVGVETWISETV